MNDSTGAWLATIALLIWAAPSVLASWALLARLPREPRRPVPWNGLDVLVVLGAYLLLLWTLVLAAHWGLGIPVGMGSKTSAGGSQAAGSTGGDRAVAGGKDHVSPGGRAGPVRLGGDRAAAVGKNRGAPSVKEETAMNPLVVVLARRHQPRTLLLCGFAAVLAAPLAEEFLIRLLLQGWLEAVEGRWRKRVRLLRRLWPGLLPVLLASALFAAVHLRRAVPPPENIDALLVLYALDAVARLLAVAFAVGYLRLHRGATAADLGFIPEKLPRDLALGLAALVFVAPFLFSVQFVVGRILPKTVAADPVTLFFFAAMMGIVYFRTHRIAPSIVMHAAFNAVMLTLAWYSLK